MASFDDYAGGEKDFGVGVKDVTENLNRREPKERREKQRRGKRSGQENRFRIDRSKRRRISPVQEGIAAFSGLH